MTMRVPTEARLAGTANNLTYSKFYQANESGLTFESEWLRLDRCVPADLSQLADDTPPTASLRNASLRFRCNAYRRYTTYGTGAYSDHFQHLS